MAPKPVIHALEDALGLSRRYGYLTGANPDAISFWNAFQNGRTDEVRKHYFNIVIKVAKYYAVHPAGLLTVPRLPTHIETLSHLQRSIESVTPKFLRIEVKHHAASMSTTGTTMAAGMGVPPVGKPFRTGDRPRWPGKGGGDEGGDDGGGGGGGDGGDGGGGEGGGGGDGWKPLKKPPFPPASKKWLKDLKEVEAEAEAEAMALQRLVLSNGPLVKVVLWAVAAVAVVATVVVIVVSLPADIIAAVGAAVVAAVGAVAEAGAAAVAAFDAGLEAIAGLVAPMLRTCSLILIPASPALQLAAVKAF